MNDITVIVLTKNEEKNIKACIESAKMIAKRVIVVDSGSTDNTVELAKNNGAEAVYHEWVGHARQFNWALDNCNINTEWVFRLDADERISKELACEIREKLASEESKDVNGYEMRWRIYFMNKWIKHGGTHKPYFLRLFRFGTGRVEDKLMDEHIIVDGAVKKLNSDLIHYDYKGLDAWLSKHIWYSQLELQMYNTQSDMTGGNEAQKQKRGFYYRLPRYFRARLYYWYRYYIQLGFLDGEAGRIFIYLQAYWYRFIVDAKIYEQLEGKDKK
ncbi:MAG: glycosyltransferase family 2 protein [Ruminococcus sp.]|nr:glycosyltransferase family 2 protein [Ruminococcus sp.]